MYNCSVTSVPFVVTSVSFIVYDTELSRTIGS